MAISSIKKPQQPLKQQPQSQQQQQPDTSGEEIRERVREAAYYRAQQRGFSPGYEIEDWLAAEAEIRKERSPGP
jgi:hypothetical protein